VNFFHVWFFLSIAGYGIIIYRFIKRRDLVQENKILERRLEEHNIEIEGSANKKLTDSERANMHSVMGGREVKPD
jgi:hypothetical protein